MAAQPEAPDWAGFLDVSRARMVDGDEPSPRQAELLGPDFGISHIAEGGLVAAGKGKCRGFGSWFYGIRDLMSESGLPDAAERAAAWQEALQACDRLRAHLNESFMEPLRDPAWFAASSAAYEAAGQAEPAVTPAARP